MTTDEALKLADELDQRAIKLREYELPPVPAVGVMWARQGLESAAVCIRALVAERDDYRTMWLRRLGRDEPDERLAVEAERDAAVRERDDYRAAIDTNVETMKLLQDQRDDARAKQATAEGERDEAVKLEKYSREFLQERGLFYAETMGKAHAEIATLRSQLAVAVRCLELIGSTDYPEEPKAWSWATTEARAALAKLKGTT
jgi:hypothetical protein